MGSIASSLTGHLPMDSYPPWEDSVPDEAAGFPSGSDASASPPASVAGVQQEPAPVEEPDLGEDELLLRLAQVTQFLVSFRVTRPEVVRATQARHALRRFGRVLREGHGGPNLYQYSEARQHIAEFWSHSWHGNAWSKVLLLLVMYHGLPALLAGTVAFATARVCIQPGQGPLPLENSLAWSTLAGVSSSGLCLGLWQSRKRVFVDPRMPSSALIPFLGGLGSLVIPFKQKRAPFLSLGYWAA